MLKLYRNIVAVGLVGLGLAACGDKVTIPPPVTPVPGVTSVTVAPLNITIAINQQVAFAASVISDVGVATTVIWTSGNAAIATVDANGLVKGITAGSTTIVATSTADPNKRGIASVTVSATPPQIMSFTITPNAATLAPGNFVQISSQFVMAPGVAAPTPTYSTSSAAVATVDASGKVIAVAAGTAVITATAVSGSSTLTATLGLTVRPLIAATVSISSVTTGILTLPVTLSNVNGQIEVNLNFDPGEQVIDSIAVFIGATRGAKQSFITNPAAGIITLSINTASFTKNYTLGTATVAFQNGNSSVSAAIYPRFVATATATELTPIQLNNIDGWAADITKPSNSAVAMNSGGPNDGFTYWGGPTASVEATIYPVIYTAGRTVSSVEWTLGAPGGGSCDWQTQTATPFRMTFGTSGITACDYENGTAIRDNVLIDMAVDNTLNPFPTVSLVTPLIPNSVILATCLPVTAGCTLGSTPDSLRLDYVGPQNDGNPEVTGVYGFSWVNAAWTFPGADAFDDGVGMADSPAFTLYRGAGLVVTDGGAASFPTETNTNSSTDGYQIFFTVPDLLGNLYTSGNSAFFGVDRTVPTIRYPVVGTLAAISTYAAADTITKTTAAAKVWAVEAIDNRSGLFDFTTNAVAGGVIQSVTRLAPGFLGTSVSLTSDNNYGATLGDGYRQTVPIPVWGSSGGTATTTGYYTYTATIRDRAGNSIDLSSAPSVTGSAAAPQRRYAIDFAAPAATGLTTPPTFGTDALTLAGTFSFSASDDLEVISARLGISFPDAVTGGTNQPIVFPALTVGTKWDGTLAGAIATAANLTTPVVATVATPDFWAGMQILCNAACSDSDGGLGEPIVAGSTYLPDSVSANAVDVFGTFSPVTASAILAGSLPATTQLAANAYSAGNITGNGIEVRWQSGTIIRQVSSYSVTLPQLARLDLFKLVSGEWVWQATIQGTAGVGSDNGLERFWDYSFGSALTPAGTYAVVSVYNGPQVGRAGTALWYQFTK